MQQTLTLLQNLFVQSDFKCPERSSDIQTKLLLAGLFLFCTVMVFIRPLPFPWKNPAIALTGIAVWFFIFGSLRDLGFTRFHSGIRTLVWTAILSLTAHFVIGDLIGPVVDYLTGTVPDYSGYEPYVGDFEAVFTFWWKAMLSAGIAEEVIYNGILLVSLSMILDKNESGKHIAILVTAVIFGIAHYPQGISGIIMTGLIGYTFGYGYFLSGRNIYALILSHCIIDTHAMFVLYYGWY